MLKPYFAKNGIELRLPRGLSRAQITEVSDVIAPPHVGLWRPIRHSEIIGLLMDRIFDRGLVVRETVHAMSSDHLEYYGIIEVRSKNYQADHSWVVAIRNNNNRRSKVSLEAGCRILHSNCISFTGEITIAMRHTLQNLLDLGNVVDGYVERLWSSWSLMDDRLEWYKRTTLVDESAHHLIARCLLKNVIRPSGVMGVLHAWDRPMRHYAGFQTRTAWSLYNIILLRHRKVRANLLPKITEPLTEIFDDYCKVRPVPTPWVQAPLL